MLNIFDNERIINIAKDLINQYIHVGYIKEIDDVLEDYKDCMIVFMNKDREGVDWLADKDEDFQYLWLAVRKAIGAEPLYPEKNSYHEDFKKFKDLGIIEHQKYLVRLTSSQNDKNEVKDNKQDLNALKQEIFESLKQEREDYREHYDQELNRLKQEYPELVELNKKHGEMVDYSSKVQAEVNVFSRNLEDFQQQLFEHLRDWQKSLYPSELKPLARCYISMLKNSNNIKKVLASFLVEEQNENTKRLQQISRNLDIILNNFEIALEGINVHIFVPQQGDAFDEIKHDIIDDEEEYPSCNAIVTRCITPGFMKENAFSDVPDILVRAIVDFEENH